MIIVAQHKSLKNPFKLTAELYGLSLEVCRERAIAPDDYGFLFDFQGSATSRKTRMRGNRNRLRLPQTLLALLLLFQLRPRIRLDTWAEKPLLCVRQNVLTKIRELLVRGLRNGLNGCAFTDNFIELRA